MKKKTYLIVIIIIILLIIGVGYVVYPIYPKDLKWTQEYVIGNPGIKGTVDVETFGDNPAYAIGANKYGYPVFKDPRKAYKQFKKDYADTLKFIRNQFNIPLPMCKFNYDIYGVYGFQVVTDDESLRYKSSEVSHFIHIYENSFIAGP
ncbi:MAG: hypothetical protein FWF46_05205 [Oscillospiraceae bacterium]|nr:hypothetical protein [Oscillospiraceae bacterium]